MQIEIHMEKKKHTKFAILNYRRIWWARGNDINYHNSVMLLLALLFSCFEIILVLFSVLRHGICKIYTLSEFETLASKFFEQ